MSHDIETGDYPPVRQQLRRSPFAFRAKIDELVQEMIDMGIVQPSNSPWSSPVVLVKKKDGSVHFCVDYRKLNQTKLDEFPLPRINDTLDLLSSGMYFTTLDLASGYCKLASCNGAKVSGEDSL